MEEKKKSNVIKIVVGVVAVILIIALVVFANNQIEKSKANKRVEEAKKELNEAVENLHNLRPNSNNNSGISNTTSTEIQDYINDYFKLEKAIVEEFTSYSGKKWGLTEIQVKNNGEKTVKEFEITVYFQDEEGKDIAEDSVRIGEYTIGNPIKPNYSWKQEEDRYYTFDNLTSEVNPARHIIKVTDIEFE